MKYDTIEILIKRVSARNKRHRRDQLSSEIVSADPRSLLARKAPASR